MSKSPEGIRHRVSDQGNGPATGGGGASTSLGGARVRRVFVRLLGQEWARADGQEETSETFRHEVVVPMEAIRVGMPFEFDIPIPGEVSSSYRGALSYHTYALQVHLDIAWATDIVAQKPIVIVR